MRPPSESRTGANVNPQPPTQPPPVSLPASQPRTAREVIDAAIQENRAWERTCLAFTVAFALTGIGVVIAGAVRDNGIVALSGAAAGALFWPGLRYASATRRENVALRMLELSLTHAKTGQQAADAIREVFLSNFRKGAGDVPTGS